MTMTMTMTTMTITPTPPSRPTTLPTPTRRFKCHVMSEGHQRQMQLFSQNGSRVLEQNSNEFKSTFLKLLERRYVGGGGWGGWCGVV